MVGEWDSRIAERTKEINCTEINCTDLQAVSFAGASEISEQMRQISAPVTAVRTGASAVERGDHGLAKG